jgi:hypothetical protein
MVINMPFIAMVEHGTIHEACVSSGLPRFINSNDKKRSKKTVQ